MARTTKVVGFSLPPEIHNKIEKLIKAKHKTRSEFFRQMIDVYLEITQKVTGNQSSEQNGVEMGEADLANILKTYWIIKSQTKLEIIIVGLAIIIDERRRVLIGALKERDLLVENLSWVFPGGALQSLDFTKELETKVKEKTGLKVKVNTIISARVYPDTSVGSAQIIALYFYCSPISSLKLKKEIYNQLRWVRPLDVFKYFTNSTSDEVTKFLATIHKARTSS